MNKIALLIMFMITFPVFAKQDAEALYQQAVIPWEQGQSNSLELMLKAANAGHTEALCNIARAYQGTAIIRSEEARQYFTKAAELGGLCGMIALSDLGSGFKLTEALTEDNGDNNWTRKAIEVTKERVKKNDIDAIKTYAFIVGISDYNGYCEWMEKAAALGDADAMKQLAGHIESGCGWYLMPGSREKAAKYWLEQAANNGNPRAMEELGGLAYDAGNVSEMLNWFDKAIETGNKNSLAMASSFLMGHPVSSMPIDRIYQDLKRAYSLNYILTIKDPNDKDEDYSPYSKLKELNKKLTKSEIDSAKKWAEEWMKTHQVRTYGLVFN
ncbi:tetratricopeptide repeat protein [Aeromonas cavernicola]|uniref:Sel1 repeat family protein n=1 Tax=Aeromonas cavernicola TaxID=1006623 RepID=A0A2H9U5R1_9GAMM|nr:sel1 repeat family protein [Aeromonas cavernicola]PJG59383.1 hypothetical protein CUC53_07525 [Aeromonas cavernicola]